MQSLEHVDPQISKLISSELKRVETNINLIASENTPP